MRHLLRALLLALVAVFVAQVFVGGGYLLTGWARPWPWVGLAVLDGLWAANLHRRRWAFVAPVVALAALTARASEVAIYSAFPTRIKVNGFVIWVGLIGFLHVIIGASVLLILARIETFERRKVPR